MTGRALLEASREISFEMGAGGKGTSLACDVGGVCEVCDSCRDIACSGAAAASCPLELRSIWTTFVTGWVTQLVFITRMVFQLVSVSVFQLVWYRSTTLV